MEVDLMRYLPTAPPGLMRYALIESMKWARRHTAMRGLGLARAPLSGLKVSSVTPIWNQIGVAVRGAGERYYNFQGVREFKEWFYPEWEPTYLVSPGGAKRPVVLANISALISGAHAVRTLSVPAASAVARRSIAAALAVHRPVLGKGEGY